MRNWQPSPFLLKRVKISRKSMEARCRIPALLILLLQGGCVAKGKDSFYADHSYSAVSIHFFVEFHEARLVIAEYTARTVQRSSSLAWSLSCS